MVLLDDVGSGETDASSGSIDVGFGDTDGDSESTDAYINAGSEPEGTNAGSEGNDAGGSKDVTPQIQFLNEMESPGLHSCR